MDCGGCEGIGSHKRWCPVAVGPSASRFGLRSVRAEDLGDMVGANEPAAANHLYAAAGILRRRALEERDRWLEQQK